MPTSKLYVSEITIPEQQALVRAFRRYYLSLDQSARKERESISPKEVHLISKVLDNLSKEFLGIFCQNPEVQKKIERSSKKTDEIFRFSSNDIRSFYLERSEEEYRSNSKYLTPRLKGRLIIFALEIKGFYSQPRGGGDNAVHFAIKQSIFGGEICRITQDISGTYQIFRRSFNSSLPNHVAVYLVNVFKDENDEGVYRYITRNGYDQKKGTGSDPMQARSRMSSGHIFNYQDQLLFFGGVAYSHMHVFEKSNELDQGQLEEENGKYEKYPEIMLFHPHGGDVLNIRGIMLGHYPFLGLPIATRAYLCRLSDANGRSFDEYLDSKVEINRGELESSLVVPRYFGNFEIGDHENTHPIQKEISKYLEFINNRVEDVYSKMLTP